MPSHTLQRAFTGMLMSGLLTACGSGGQETRLVELGLSATSVPAPTGSLTDYTRADGWNVHLDQASVQLGSVYLRAPKRRPIASWWRALVSQAHAHSGHAQTLTEGQVIGEHLEPIEVDALSPALVKGGAFLSEDTQLDRLSVALGRGLGSDTPIATVRGYAERERARVDFACALRIDQDPDESPENLEERRRVDQIRLASTPRVSEGAELRILVHSWRWLERVDFDALIGDEDPCSSPRSTFISQWYLGIRRPEAFSAELSPEE